MIPAHIAKLTGRAISNPPIPRESSSEFTIPPKLSGSVSATDKSVVIAFKVSDSSFPRFHTFRIIINVEKHNMKHTNRRKIIAMSFIVSFLIR
jgi:hypothetical protein